MLNISKNLKIAIFFVLIGCIIHFIGFVSPSWNVLSESRKLRDTESTLRLGLWKTCRRHGTGEKCVQYDEIKHMAATKCLETLTVILYVFTLMTFWLYRRHPVYGSQILVASMVFDILIVETTTIGALCWVTISDVQENYNLSWAFGLTVSSVIFPAVAGWFVSQERRSFMQQWRPDSLAQPEKRDKLLY